MNAPTEEVLRNTAVLSVLTELGMVVLPKKPVSQFEETGSPVVHKQALYPHPRELSLICDALASQFLCDNIEVVVGTGCGGAILAHSIARSLHTLGNENVHSIYAEKSVGTGFSMQPGFKEYLVKRRVLLVDEELKRDSPALALMKYVGMHGGNVVGIASFCSRGGVTSDHFGRHHQLKLASLITLAR